MKKDLHPEMVESTITCACGANFVTMSNQDAHVLEVCNNCHPAYNENIRITHKKTGAVEKFNRKFNLNQEQAKPEPKKETKKAEPEAPVIEEVVEETPAEETIIEVDDTATEESEEPATE